MKSMKKTTRGKKTAIKIGAGLVAASAVAAAGYYFYGSKNAKNNRKIASKWAAAMKKEVIKEVKHLEEASPKAYAAVVDRVAKTYQAARSIGVEDVKRAASELKENWEKVKRETKRPTRKKTSRAKSVGKSSKIG